APAKAWHGRSASSLARPKQRRRGRERRGKTEIGVGARRQPGVLPAGPIFQGGYEISRRSRLGSFPRVYKARQLSAGQAVAIARSAEGPSRRVRRGARADSPQPCRNQPCIAVAI